MTKLTKVNEFCHLIKKMERSETLTLGTLDHFRHFSSLVFACSRGSNRGNRIWPSDKKRWTFVAS